MPRNSSGVFTLAQPQFQPDTTISSSAVNSDLSDIASTMTTTVATTGVSPMTGPLLSASGLVSAPTITFASFTGTGFYVSNQAAFQVSLAINSIQELVFATTGNAIAIPIVDRNANQMWGMPPGLISPYAGLTAPTYWLLCFGQLISRITYAALFASIGTTYSAGDGSTTFGVPDLRGRTVYGKDNMGGSTAGRITNAIAGFVGTTLGAAGGVQTITIAKANLPAVTFTLTDPTHLHTFTQGASICNVNSGGASGYSGVGGSTTGSSVTGVSFTSGGSGTALTIIDPLLITSYIIYAGV